MRERLGGLGSGNRIAWETMEADCPLYVVGLLFHLFATKRASKNYGLGGVQGFDFLVSVSLNSIV